MVSLPTLAELSNEASGSAWGMSLQVQLGSFLLRKYARERALVGQIIQLVKSMLMRNDCWNETLRPLICQRVHLIPPMLHPL